MADSTIFSRLKIHVLDFSGVDVLFRNLSRAGAETDLILESLSYS